MIKTGMNTFFLVLRGTILPSSARSTFLFLRIHLIYYILLVSVVGISHSPVSGTECVKRKYFEVTITFGGIRVNQNRTMKCDMYFQWTVADYCCFDKFDRYEENPYCCYSETYKLVLAAGFICLVLLATTFSIFFCWVYNLPHHILYLFTCGKFSLNNWMSRNKNGPYVDPSFYSGEPFWARGAEMQMYPLRPMPPKIFYPAPPTKLKYRWDMANGEIPLFVIASRQFTRNPYSARPQDRSGNQSTGTLSQITSSSGGFLSSISESRRSSLSSNHNGPVSTSGGGGSGNGGIGTIPESPKAGSRRESDSATYTQQKRANTANYRDLPPFKVNIDEVEAAAELIEAINMLEKKDKAADSPGSEVVLVPNEEKIVTRNSTRANNSSSRSNPMTMMRPNTTGSSEYLDSRSSSSSSFQSGVLNRPQIAKPNVEALNHQLSTLGMPVYSMPGVNTPDVVSTVQNYHVVSTNLGNPMETILEDDSYDEEFAAIERNASKKKFNPGASTKKGTESHKRANLKRRATANSFVPPTQNARVSSALDHVLNAIPTTAAIVPFTPNLPGSLTEEHGGTTVDTDFVNAAINNIKHDGTEARRNSII